MIIEAAMKYLWLIIMIFCIKNKWNKGKGVLMYMLNSNASGIVPGNH